MCAIGSKLLVSAIQASVSPACVGGTDLQVLRTHMFLNAAVLQEEDSHALEELLGFPLLKDGTRLGWLMNLNSVRRLDCMPYLPPD